MENRIGIVKEIDVLGGEDVMRRTSKILVEVRPNGIYDPRSGEKYENLGPSDLPLMGWGKLDGPAYDVRPEGCAWVVSVPQRVWDRLSPKP